MGWTVYYRGTISDRDGSLTGAELATLQRHVHEWAPRLHDGCEAYAYAEELLQNGFAISGFVKVQGSYAPLADFVTIIEAVQQLERELPRFTFSVLDDFVFTNRTKPSSIDVDQLKKDIKDNAPAG